MKYKKIAFSGASCTGKTTMKNILSEILDIPAIGENAREACDFVGCHFKEMNNEQFMKFEEKILELKENEENCKDSFISDRSHLDILAYTALRLSETQEEFVKKLRNRCFLNTINNYDLIIIFPFDGIPYVDDGFRSGNREKEYHIDSLLKAYYNEIHSITELRNNNCKNKLKKSLKRIINQEEVPENFNPPDIFLLKGKTKAERISELLDIIIK